MRIIRFIDESGVERLGVPRNENAAEAIEDVFGLLTGRPTLPGGAAVSELIADGRAFRMTSRVHRIASVQAPIEPVNVLCAGRNYRASSEPAAELPPLELFMKPTSAIQHPGGPIIPPDTGPGESDVDAEGELAVMIGETLRDVDERDAAKAVVGAIVAIDVTDRRWQTASGPPLWMRGKGFDTFCPVGRELVTSDELGDALAGGSGWPIRTRVNGETRRDGETAHMIRSAARLASEISRSITILPGTLLLTGAPLPVAAVGDRCPKLVEGDVVEVEVGTLGRLTAPVRARSRGFAQ